ncbi:hypothetical protein CHUAL_012224 [Chamberlinius hualienensis]
MTVSYQYDVASSSSGGFTRLLFKWKGSVYKLVWRELVWFSFAYTLLSVLYRTVLTEEQKRSFERVADYFDKFLGHIPLSFVLGVYVTLVVQRWWSQFLAIPWPDKTFEKLVVHCEDVLALIPLTFITGFYVTFVATRWWQQFEAIPWPDRLCHCISLYVNGNDEPSRIIRRTLVRYLNLTLILVLRSISMAVKKRFPTLQHLVEGGFMTKLELDIYLSVPSSEFNTYWIPCTWIVSLIKDARNSHMITDSQGLKLLVEEFNEFRSKCGALWSYDWVSIPLVYTQVVTLATYSFFAACVIGRQYVQPIVEEDKRKFIDLYVPIFTFLQFFFYMGLLKVAEALINPFGDDDEDFELNWMIDRHLKVSYLVVDTLMNRIPPVLKDVHYEIAEPTLAYTKAAMMYKKKTFRGSVAAVLVPEDEQTLVLPEIMEEDEEALEHASDLSSNKTSNSIINLLTWTSNTGSKIMSSHHKKNSLDDVRIRKSSSFSDDPLKIMESGQLLGEVPRRRKDPAAAVAARYPTSAGIRGKVFPAPFGSVETVLSQTINESPRLGISSQEKFRGLLIRGESAETGSNSSLSHYDVELSSSGPPAITSFLPDNENANSRSSKSRSLDMGSEPAINNDANTRNRSKSYVTRLRDLKRKNSKLKKQSSQSSPPKVKHRFWRSKGSLPKLPINEEETPEATNKPSTSRESTSVPDTPSIAAGCAISLSLPSIHIALEENNSHESNGKVTEDVGTSDPNLNSLNDEEEMADLPNLISMFAKNDVENKLGQFNIGKYSPSVSRKPSIKSVLPKMHGKQWDSSTATPLSE